MSAPIIWIVFPILFMLFLLALRRRRKAVNTLGIFFSFLLAVMALVIPVNQTAGVGLFPFSLVSDWSVLGRVFSIRQTDLPFISFLYFIVTVWFFLSRDVEHQTLFIPLGLGVVATIIAALAVQPFVYAAMLIEAAVLGCVVMLIDSRYPVGRGTMRFLILQSLGMPFILLAGWFLASGEITPLNPTQLTLSIVLLILGFASWIGLFPLHTWIPMIAEDGNTLAAGFIFSILPLSVIFFLMDFMNSYTWLREYPLLYPVLRWLGSFMVLFAGVWAFFQKDLRQLFGYLIIALNGMALLSIGIKGDSGITLLTYFFLPRFLSIILFASSLLELEKAQIPFNLEEIPGLVGKAPFATLALLISIFSISGLPLLPGFPFVQSLIYDLINLSHLALILYLIGMLMFFLTGLHILTITQAKTTEGIKIKETPKIKSLLSFAMFLLLLAGIFPGFINSFFLKLANKFPLLMH